MSYPFVQSATDLGPAKGPRLAMVWHMAEGGGTVGYLSRPNPRNVSVHFVVEYDGTIVQMLQLDHMHSSLNPNLIRTGDDANGLYGRSHAVAIMGDWADIDHGTPGPNHASVAVECEGYANVGPNVKQTLAIHQLAAYVGIPSHLGHRDFQDYKACPGQHFPWATIGGHANEGAIMDWKIMSGWPGTFTCTASGAGWIDPDTFTTHAMPKGTVVNILAPVHVGGKWDKPGYLGSDATVHGRLVLAGDGMFVPSLPCPPTGDVTHPVSLVVDGKIVWSDEL